MSQVIHCTIAYSAARPASPVANLAMISLLVDRAATDIIENGCWEFISAANEVTDRV
jgi:hypothetical protein